MRAELARVDVMRQGAYFGEQFALGFDALGQGARIVRERMAAAGLGKALDQRVRLGIEEQHAQVDRSLAQLRDPSRQFLQRWTAAYVHADRNASVAFVRKKIDEAGQQIDRQ